MVFVCACVFGFVPVTSAEFVTQYRIPADPGLRQLHDEFVRTRLLEDVAAGLNAELKLPRKVTLMLDECGVANALYDPDTSRIVLCYELFADLARRIGQIEEAETLIGGAFSFILLHELGHALIDQLDLPVTGREEDAADQLATVALIDADEGGVDAVAGAAVWFASLATDGEIDTLEFADEHGLNAQRFYNLLCWVYGADPAANADVVGEDGLPESRAGQCPAEYARLSASWERPLGPHAARP
jgi:hypothetical protein